MGCGSSSSSAAQTPEAKAGPEKPAAAAPKKHATVSDKYELGKALGSGSFATCRIGTNKEKPDDKVAVKSLLRSHENFDEELLRHEIKIMTAVAHPRCIRLIEVFEDSKAVHLVEELATGGELFDRILDLGYFTEKDAALVMKQVLEGIEHMHSIGACHRDLKPENLLMVSGDKSKPEYNQVKIADFGLSSLRPVEAEDTTMNTVCGTPDYLAPEVIIIASEGSKSRKTYDARVDVWAIGVIWYTMLCGYPPFWSENMAEMLHMIRKGDYSFPSPAWDQVSKETKDFITFMLQVDPQKRPTSKECLTSAYLSKTSEISTQALKNEHLKEYLVARRHRKGLNAVKAVARMEMIMRASTAQVDGGEDSSKRKAKAEAANEQNNKVK